jgi:hypothetical protein
MSTNRGLSVVLVASIVMLAVVASLILSAGRITPPAMADESMGEADSLNSVLAGRLSPETRLTPPQCDNGDQDWPAVAYNPVHNEYLVLWENTWPGGKQDIYARRVSATGEILSWFSVTTGTEDRRRPALAYNAANDEYLVVWMQEVSGNVFEIWGRLVALNGSSMKPEFHLHCATSDSFSRHIAKTWISPLSSPKPATSPISNRADAIRNTWTLKRED